MAETLEILSVQPEERGRHETAKQIESLFEKRCKEFKEEYHMNFGVYYTPAENLCYTAMKKFKSKYGIIKERIRKGILYKQYPYSSVGECYIVREDRS